MLPAKQAAKIILKSLIPKEDEMILKEENRNLKTLLEHRSRNKIPRSESLDILDKK